ncbi:MAG TPA: hypothetical protein VK422_00430 [Pyrinomonadaceae bacterium]|nr:hypothetical protein [Pyrinomonadaceae bacterium]
MSRQQPAEQQVSAPCGEGAGAAFCFVQQLFAAFSFSFVLAASYIAPAT